MPDLLKDGLAWAEDQIDCHMSCPAKYRCPSVFEIATDFTVHPFGSVQDDATNRTNKLKVKSQSFRIRRSKLVDPNTTKLHDPQRNDEIEIDYAVEGSGTEVRRVIYRVTGPAGNPHKEEIDGVIRLAVIVRATVKSETVVVSGQ